MKQIKGKIEQHEYISFTCCDSRPNISIDGVSLHHWIKDQTTLTEPYHDDNPTNEDAINWNVRYVIQDKPFDESLTFEDAAARIQVAMLSSSPINGCYSEWTCGWTCGTGDYDFVLNGNHSILEELSSYVGQYVWLVV